MAKRKRPTRCKQCGTDEGQISYRALCQPCAIANMTSAAVELRAHEGPAWDAYRESRLRQAQGVIDALT